MKKILVYLFKTLALALLAIGILGNTTAWAIGLISEMMAMKVFVFCGVWAVFFIIAGIILGEC